MKNNLNTNTIEFINQWGEEAFLSSFRCINKTHLFVPISLYLRDDNKFDLFDREYRIV
jgi:hypothetical protein